MSNRRLALLIVCLTCCALVTPAQTAEEVWRHFAGWVRNSPPTSSRDKPVMDLYTEKLVSEGFSEDEARRRVKLIAGELRQKSRANNSLYWDAMFHASLGWNVTGYDAGCLSKTRFAAESAFNYSIRATQRYQ